MEGDPSPWGIMSAHGVICGACDQILFSGFPEMKVSKKALENSWVDTCPLCHRAMDRSGAVCTDCSKANDICCSCGKIKLHIKFPDRHNPSILLDGDWWRTVNF